MANDPRRDTTTGGLERAVRARWERATPGARAVLVLGAVITVSSAAYAVRSYVREHRGCCARRAASSSSCCARRAGAMHARGPHREAVGAPETHGCAGRARAEALANVARVSAPLRAYCAQLGDGAARHPVCRTSLGREGLPAGVRDAVAPFAAPALQPAVAYNPERREVGAAWVEAGSDGISVYFARLAPTGERVGNPVRVSGAGRAVNVLPSVAYNAGGYVLAWTQIDAEQEQFTVVARRLDAEGRASGEPATLSETRNLNVGPRVAALPAEGATPAQFAVTWLALDPSGEGDSVRVARLSANGAKAGRERLVRDGIFVAGLSDVSAAAGGFVVGWNEFDFRSARSRTMLARFGRDDAPGRAQEVAGVAGLEGSLGLAARASGHLLAWEHGLLDAHASVFASAVNESAVELPPRSVSPGNTNSGGPAVAALDDGALVGFAFETGRGNEQVAVAVTALARDGRASAPRRLSEPSGEGMMPALARTDASYLAAWVDTRRGAVEIFAQRVSASGEPQGRPLPISAR